MNKVQLYRLLGTVLKTAGIIILIIAGCRAFYAQNTDVRITPHAAIATLPQVSG